MHIALDAKFGRLPGGPCKACDKNLLKRGLGDCRGSTPLNGADAVAEFTRALLPTAKRQLLAEPKPDPVLSVVPVSAEELQAREVAVGRLADLGVAAHA